MRERGSGWEKHSGRSQLLQEGKKRKFSVPHGTSDIPPKEAWRTFLLHAPKGTTTEQPPELLLLKAARAGQNSSSTKALKLQVQLRVWGWADFSAHTAMPAAWRCAVMSEAIQVHSAPPLATKPVGSSVPQELFAAFTTEFPLASSVYPVTCNSSRSSAQIHLKLLQKVN